MRTMFLSGNERGESESERLRYESHRMIFGLVFVLSFVGTKGVVPLFGARTGVHKKKKITYSLNRTINHAQSEQGAGC